MRKRWGVFGLSSKIVYETRWKTVSEEKIDDCGYASAYQTYHAVLAESESFNREMKQRS